MANDPTRVDLAEKLATFDEHRSPRVGADDNGNDVMVVKFAGAFPFHRHEDRDDLFLVLKGSVTIEYEDGGSAALGPGDLCVVPAGVVHHPRAEAKAKVMLLEPAGMPNTGDPATAAPRPRV